MNVLERIVETTRQTVARDRQQCPPDRLAAAIADAPAPRGFVRAIAQRVGRRLNENHLLAPESAAGAASGMLPDAASAVPPIAPAAVPPIALIAEVKRASPSAGQIRADFDPPRIAAAYTDGGATCISVLTDQPFFQGSLEDLHGVRAATELPILRKDFIIDDYQIDQARAAGADAVLLIAECLSPVQLKDLYEHAVGLGMDALIELYEIENLDAVLDTGAPLIGVNNRNLRTFETNLQHCLDVGAKLPLDRLLVAESGIHTPEDARRVAIGGAHAMLVGESLMRQDDVRLATRRLLGTETA